MTCSRGCGRCATSTWPRLREGAGRHEYDGVDPGPVAGRRAQRAWPRWPRRPRRASPWRTRTTRRTWPRSRIAPGSPSASWSCTGATRCSTCPASTWPATTGTTRRQAERDRARLAHLAAWPQAVDAAIAALDQVSAPVATALLGGDPRAWRPASRPTRPASTPAPRGRRTPGWPRTWSGPPPPATPTRRSAPPALTALMSSAERMEVDLGRLAERADAERDRLLGLLAASCARIDASRPAAGGGPRTGPRPSRSPTGSSTRPRHWTQQAIDFTRERDLVPYHDGECLVGLAPESRRWAMAMMSWAAPGRAGGPVLVPHHPARRRPGRQREQEEWLEVFSATTLPGITVHEVAPGHFSHGRALRHAATDGRGAPCTRARSSRAGRTTPRNCASRRGSARDDPRFAVGVWLEALVRVTRLACAIGVHTAGMTRRGGRPPVRGGHAPGRARRAVRGPPGHLRPDLRPLHLGQAGDHGAAGARPGSSGARASRCAGSTPAMLGLGSPPLGLLGTAIVRG